MMMHDAMCLPAKYSTPSCAATAAAAAATLWCCCHYELPVLTSNNVRQSRCLLPLLVQVVAAANGQLRVMIAGAPAAGKGTQCAKIVEKVRP